MCDCGDIVFSKGIKINKNDTFQTFKNKVIDDFCLTFPSIVDQYISGGVQLIKQDESEASHSKIISKSDGEIMPSDTAESAYRKFRAFSSWPRVFTVVSGTRVIFHEAKLENDSFLVDSLQVEGKKIITGKDFVNGYPNLLTGMPNFVIINKN
jgi:methionyl-tRNA formyltransferase